MGSAKGECYVLTWMGFIGKLIEFMATKLIGKRLDLALDKKKKACKTFLEFLDSFSRLESLFDQFVKYVESLVAGRNSHIYKAHLEKFTSELSDASKDFLKNLEAVGKVVYLYDPNLTRLFSRVMRVKLSLLTLITSEFFQPSSGEYEVQRETDVMDFENIKLPVMRFDCYVVDNPYFRGLDFTLPKDELMKLDLNEVYDNVRHESDDSPLDLFGTSRTRQSTDILLNLVKDKYLEKHIGPDDIDILIDLYPTFKSHQDVLRQARESLREFIRENFSLEDLLYVVH